MVRLSPRSFRVVSDHEQRPSLASVPLDADHVGIVLHDAREAAGYALSDIAYTLRIRYLFLQAIEEGRFVDLPGTTYAVGFVRSYADYLGLDAAAVVARFKAETAGARGETSLAFPEPAPERRFFPGAPVIILSLLLAGAAFGSWIYLQDEEDVIAERIAEPPALPAFERDQARAKAKKQLATNPPEVTQPSQAAAVPQKAPAVLAQTKPPATVSPSPPEGEVADAEVPGRDVPRRDVPRRDVPGGEGEIEVAVAAGTPNPSGPESRDLPTASDGDVAEPIVTTLVQAPPQADTVSNPATSVTPTSNPVLPEPAAAVAQQPLLPTPALSRAPTQAPAPTGNATAAVAAEATSGPAPLQLASKPVPEPAAQPTLPLGLPAVPSSDAFDGGSGRVYGNANRNARIVLLATADSWVQVRDGAQNVLLTRMLRAGDSYRVPDKADLWLLTGNAGGLDIKVDGQSVARLGPSGEVRRDVPLDPTALKAR